MALVVIGGVAAGLSAAARARRISPHLEIVVLEKGPVISLGACGLPYFVEGRVRQASDLIVYTPEYFRKQRNIDVRTGSRVVTVSHPRREVTLESGERVRYEHLVIATGARYDTCAIASLPEHVFTLHTLDDATRLRAFIRDKHPRHAAVIGAGYIGLEAADALRRNGLRVTVLERSQQLLLRDDAWWTGLVRHQLNQYGVELRCGVDVRATDFPADVVVFAAGFRPNVELAAEAGIEIGRTGAIRTDDHMETSLRGVYAAGDCAEVGHLVTGRPTWIPLGTTANKTGRVAGANATGHIHREGLRLGLRDHRPHGHAGPRRRILAGRGADRSQIQAGVFRRLEDERGTGRRPCHSETAGWIGSRRGWRRRAHRRDCHGTALRYADRSIRAARSGLFPALFDGMGPAPDRRPAVDQATLKAKG